MAYTEVKSSQVKSSQVVGLRDRVARDHPELAAQQAAKGRIDRASVNSPIPLSGAAPHSSSHPYAGSGEVWLR